MLKTLEITNGAVEAGLVLYNAGVEFTDDESLYDSTGREVGFDFELDAEHGDTTYEIR